MKVRLLLFLLTALTTALFAQDNYEITIEIEGYDQPELYLAYSIMDKQYIADTATVNDAGKFVFSSATSELPRGIYLVVLAPDNVYFQILVGSEKDQVFSLKTEVDNLSDVAVKSSPENQLFFEYMDYLSQQQEKVAPIRTELADSSLTDIQRAELEEVMEVIDKEVSGYQNNLVQQYPESFLSAIIKANAPNPPPAYEDIADEEERNTKKLIWLREHYFDNIDLQDDRLLRTPFLFSRINYFVDKLFVQHPDTISQAIDQVLMQMDPRSELFQNYVVHFVNKAAGSKIVGMDAVYVHMVDNYYANGRAYWADKESVDKMIAQVAKIRPLLIGKDAPNMQMKRRDGTPVELYDIKANYTVLYFWQFACGSCKKATPVMKEFYAKWKDKGVEIFSVCTKQGEIDKCWEYVDEKGIGDWLHATDRFMRFYKDYDIRSTPSIFVLDENKKIVSKRIGASQLDELLTALEKQKEAEKGK